MDLQKQEYKQIQNKTYAKVNHRATECDCLPACTSIDYEAEVTQGTFDLKKMLQASDVTVDFMDEQPGFRLVQVRIFFKEAQFLTSQRSELFGRTEFIASCGGLLGLFMGVSALSFVEVIYFCTARLFTNLKLRKTKRLELRRMHIRDVVSNNDMSKQC